VVAVASVVPVSLLVSMVRRVATRTVDCCLEQCATGALLDRMGVRDLRRLAVVAVG
jgi:hypothetical protein